MLRDRGLGDREPAPAGGYRPLPTTPLWEHNRKPGPTADVWGSFIGWLASPHLTPTTQNHDLARHWFDVSAGGRMTIGQDGGVLVGVPARRWCPPPLRWEEVPDAEPGDRLTSQFDA